MKLERVPVAFVIVSAVVSALAIGCFVAGVWVGRGLRAPGPEASDARFDVRLSALEQRIQAVLTAHAAAQAAAPAGAPAAPPAPPPREVLAELHLAGAPALGPANAPVTVVAFADFECPFCARVETSLTQLRREYPDRVRIVFKNFPLPMHAHARDAAKAALFAEEHGKFWPMHDWLFANQHELDRDSLAKQVAAMGLDAKALATAFDSPAIEKRIDDDIAEGSRVGVRGTPSFFINGRFLSGAQPYAAFKAQVDQALADAGVTPKVALRSR